MDTNAAQRIPPLFLEVIRNDAERAAMTQQTVVPFEKAGELVREKRMYRKAAEIALAWNTNKGSTA
jgi:hypothetical protein